MKAAIYRERGPSAVLTVVEMPRPEPGAGEVRVAVEYSGVNPTDWKMRAAGDPVPDFQIPNQDGAGVIDAVGAGVDAARIGERVWVFHAAYQRPWGTAAEFTVIPAAQAIPMSDVVDFAQGAGLAIPFVTAHGCLHLDGPIAGQTVLVAGGAGAVGHAAIQMARLSGARVITTVSSSDKARIAQTAGPDLIVNYRDADAAAQIRAAAPGGVDRVIEVALGANLDLDLAVTRPGAAVVTYATEPGGDPVLPVRRLMTANLRLDFALVYTFAPTRLNAAVTAVAEAANAGALVPLPTHVFSLDHIAEAHDAVQGGAVGKVLVRIGG
jgi:NADPH2:quinone reductase